MDTSKQNETQTNKNLDHKKNTTESPLVIVTKTYNAPVEKVWAMWADAENLKQWWGPQNYSCPSAKLDFRPGGKYHYAMKDDKTGKVQWSGGTFEVIDGKKKIVCTDSFTDEKGKAISPKEAGMPNYDGSGLSFITIEFEKLGDQKTKMTVSHEGLPKQWHDDCVKGWSSSLDKIKPLVENK